MIKYLKARYLYSKAIIKWWTKMPIWSELNSGNNFKLAHDRWDAIMPKWEDYWHA